MRRPATPRRRHAAALVALALAAALAAGCGGSGTRATTVAGRPDPAAASDPSPSAHRARAPNAAARSSVPVSASQYVPAPRPAHPVAPAHPVPAAFRVAPGAPSDAEVRRELAQMQQVQRQALHQQLSAEAASAAGLLPWLREPKSNQVSIASVFTDYGLGLACGGVLARDEIGVAHKTAPCGTQILFTYNGRQLVVPVIDRGPFIAGREWDLTGAAAAALGFPGLGSIAWSVVG